MAKKLNNAVLFTKVDATVETALAKKHEIKGYPTVKTTFGGQPLADYKGPRTEDAVEGVAKELLKNHSKVIEIEASVEKVERVVREKRMTAFFGGKAVAYLVFCC